MSVKIELQQLLDIALATPEVGNVNFIILRGFLYEVLKHLGIRKKAVYVSDEGDFKTVCDFIRDGVVLLHSRPPSELDLIDEHKESPTGSGVKLRGVSPARISSPVSSLESKDQVQTAVPKRIRSASPRLSHRSVTLATGESPKTLFTDDQMQAEPRTQTDEQQVIVSEASKRSPTRSPMRSPKISKHLLEIGKVSLEPKKSVEVLLGRGEILKNLARKVSELQTRIDVLENTEVPMIASAASVIRKESKTPAHDMKQIISVNKKLEETESAIDGLTELIDVMNADLTNVKEMIPHIERIPAMSTQVDQLGKSIEGVKTELSKSNTDKEISELEQKLQDAKNIAMEAMNKPVPTLDMNEVEKVVDDKIEQEMGKLVKTLAQQQSPDKAFAAPIVVHSEPPREVTEALQKIEALVEQQASLQEQVQEIRDLAEAMETKDDEESEENITPPPNVENMENVEVHSVQVHIPHEVVHDLKLLKKKVDSCSKDAQSTHSSLRRLDVDGKKMSSMFEDQKMEIEQLKNNFHLLQRELAESVASPVKQEDVPTPVPSRSRTRSVDNEDMSLIRAMIFDLQEEKDKLKQANKGMTDEIRLKQKDMDDLYDRLVDLSEMKADKTYVASQVDVKADKTQVDLKVGRDDLDHYIGLVDSTLRDLLQRLEGQEEALKQAIDGLAMNVNTKLDKHEVEPLKQYLEARMKAMKPKPVEVPPPEEFAAGFRKVLIKNFNCISCDRPVEYAREGIFPPLPSAQAMPGKKSNRPYTTFELEQIRQHMIHGGMNVDQEKFEMIDKQRQRLQNELLKLSGVPNIQDLAEVIDRPCGGSHTLSLPHSQHIVRGLHMNKEEVTIETIHKLNNYQAVDILGQDGHIYKGLVEDMPHLPHLPHKPQTPRKTPPQQQQDNLSGRPVQRSTTPASEQFKDPEQIDDPGSS